MGIKNLKKFLERNLPSDSKAIQEIRLTDLSGQVLAIDSSIYIYKFTCGIRNSAKDLYNDQGESVTHIHAIVNNVGSLIQKSILPINIFDGKPTDQKVNVSNARSTIKNTSASELEIVQRKIKSILRKLNIKPKTLQDIKNILELFEKYKALAKYYTKLLKKTTTIETRQITECKEVLKVMGIPFIQSPTESDPQCAQLVKDGYAFATMTEDMDLLTYGSTRVVTNVSKSKNQCNIFNLEIILEELKITMDQFIDICILLGCDYTCTIPEIGYAKIYNIIKKYKTIENYIENDPNILSGKIVVPDDFDYIKARHEFNYPIVETTGPFVWKIPDYEKLHRLLVDKYGFTEDKYLYIENLLSSKFYSKHTGQKEFKKKEIFISMESDED